MHVHITRVNYLAISAEPVNVTRLSIEERRLIVDRIPVQCIVFGVDEVVGADRIRVANVLILGRSWFALHFRNWFSQYFFDNGRAGGTDDLLSRGRRKSFLDQLFDNRFFDHRFTSSYS